MNDSQAMSERLQLCAAKTRRGTPCKRPAGSGTDHVGYGRCRHHGGSTRTHRKSAARQEALAEVQRLDELATVNPLDALSKAVDLAYARMASCAERAGSASADLELL